METGSKRDGWARPETCARCGEPFERSMHHRKYCSAECAKAAYKERHDEYMRRYAVDNAQARREKDRARYRAKRERVLRERMVARRLEEVGA